MGDISAFLTISLIVSLIVAALTYLLTGPVRSFVMIAVIFVATFWMSFNTIDLVIEGSNTEYSINSPEMKQRMSNCSGNFQQRQLCAEGIAEELQQRGFLALAKKTVIIIGPPLLLWGAYQLLLRQRGRAPAPARRPLPPRRLATGLSPEPRSTRARMEEDEAAMREPKLQPPPRQRGPEIPGETPVFTGGRRGPVRRRDR